MHPITFCFRNAVSHCVSVGVSVLGTLSRLIPTIIGLEPKPIAIPQNRTEWRIHAKDESTRNTLYLGPNN